jgi:hypothetical protein
MNFIPYYQKLRDPRWQRKRLEVFNRSNFKCQGCQSSTSELHVHHPFYEKGKEPWEYDTEHLICLCCECHEIQEWVKGDLGLLLAKMPTHTAVNLVMTLQTAFDGMVDTELMAKRIEDAVADLYNTEFAKQKGTR